jgi:cytochrome c oxidase accessory protein FixG
METRIPETESFRDTLATVSKEGKRKWIYPKKPQGKFYNARNVISVFLLLILFVTPFIKIGGHPLFMFDILERNFILFGIPFGPHDFHLFVLVMIGLIIFIILFTAVFGRVFCGWVCPQTVFMEMVFRKIEYLIEGDSRDQKRLKELEWDSKKIFKKTSKHLIFFALAFLIANFLLAYIIGIDSLYNIIIDPPSEHIRGLLYITLFSGLFYWIFAYFREQACTIVCPYGRLQGVLLDSNSLVIAYDYKRGEPRSRIKRNEEAMAGDCIDCSLCVDVCPTGIDIRDGIQLECVNCTACIDACDAVMEKIKRPKGLIRYDSLNGIEKQQRFKITPRIMSYSALLLVILSVLVYLFSVRTDFSINILRTPGMLFQEQPGDIISNLYDVSIINKTFDNRPVNLKLENIKGEIKLIGTDIKLMPQGNYDGKFLVLIPKDIINKMNTPLMIGVYSNGKLLQQIKTSFLGPMEVEEDEED